MEPMTVTASNEDGADFQLGRTRITVHLNGLAVSTSVDDAILSDREALKAVIHELVGELR